LRDYLAIERTILTNEGTVLAYIRTSLTIAVVGVTILNLYPENRNLQTIGIALASTAVIIFSVGLIRTLRMRKKINRFLKHREEVEIDDKKTS
jgi:putative membrane protein